MMPFLVKLLAGLLICFTSTSFAWDISQYPSEFRSGDKQHQRVSVRHIEKGGIGYDQGYTTFEGFFSTNPDYSSVMPFLDLRAHVFNNGKFASNLGVGLRKIEACRAYGLNAYYDYRKTQKNNYNQIGFGLETIGNLWDFRINGYFPVAREIEAISSSKFAGFLRHHMMFSQKYRFAMKGGNAELGFHFGKSDFYDFYAAFGPYGFSGKIGPQIWGGKGRFVFRYKEYLTLELSNSYDKMFRNRFQGQITLTLPFGSGSCANQNDSCKSCCMPDVLLARMVQPVERQEIIVLGCKRKRFAAIDPTTGNPFNFIFVDNTSHSLGTYESPYPTLALAQANSGAGDIIYVFPGDGTTAGMDAGIILKYNQKFWGSGINHAIRTSQGNIIIPAFSASAPKITNAVGNGVTLSSVNQVSGFIITDVSDNGIFGTNVKDIDISNCTINNSQLDQIHLEYSGPIGVLNLNNLNIKNGVQNAVFIDSAASSNVCTISDCIVQDNIFGINASFSNQANLSLINNVIERNGDLGGGGYAVMVNFAGPSKFLASGNTLNNNRSINSAPIFITAATSPLSATIKNNIISENVCSAMHFVLNNTDSAQLTIDNNIISNNGTGSIGTAFGSSIFIDSNNTSLGNCRLNLINNSFSDNSSSALYCANGNFNDFQVNATDNAINNNGGSGFVFANPCNTFKFDAANNIISNGGDHGITTGSININEAIMNISNNQITGNSNSASGIALSHEGTDLNLVVTDNNISENASSGIVMYSSSTIENVLVEIENNTINNNQNLGFNSSAGIDLEQFNNLSGTIKNNTLSNNTTSALYIGSTEASPSVCIEMTGNSSDTGYTLVNNAGTFNLAPCNVDTVNVGAITTMGTITIVQSCPDAVPCAP